MARQNSWPEIFEALFGNLELIWRGKGSLVRETGGWGGGGGGRGVELFLYYSVT